MAELFVFIGGGGGGGGGEGNMTKVELGYRYQIVYRAECAFSRCSVAPNSQFISNVFQKVELIKKNIRNDVYRGPYNL